jgi:2-polyprenyl-3-methyl-5-hydroxy-6-metoxy-1,4-benzoquinol methylase
MAKEAWTEIRELIAGQSFELGPYFAHQLRHSPRHILFTLSRYKFAAKMLPLDRTVDILEIGCSEGVGTNMLAERGHHVTGIDADGEAIAHAKKSIGNPNLTFLQGDFIGRSIGLFDVCVTLDVIEHISAESEQAFIDSIKANLKDEGFCIVGTPNDTASQYASKASQIGHVNLFEAERLYALLRKNFTQVFMFGMNDELVHTGFYPMCHYLMAIACSPRRDQ